MSDKTDPLTLDRLLGVAVETLWSDPDQRQGHAVRTALALLTPANRLSLIADLVSGLPHGPGTPGPGLELGESAEAYALLEEQMKRPEVPHLKRGEYVSVQINGLWFGASKPKEGK